MAEPRYGYWLQDMSASRSGPSTAGALMLFVILGMVLWALLASPWATAESGRAHPPTSPPACAQHMPPTCKEASHARP
jgi:hypothetical protein